MNRRFWIPVVAFPVAVIAFAVAATSFVGPESGRTGGPSSAGFVRTSANATPEQGIADLQQRTRSVPNDFLAWAALGLSYVKQANGTGTPALYGKAESAIRQSLRINKSDNYVGYGAMAALAAGRHQFRNARVWAKRGLAINPHNAPLYGILTDAETQVGNYPAAFAAAQKMIDISPDTASLARVSYTWELRGDIPAATDYMQRALEAAANKNDENFARYFLGELLFNQGKTTEALTLHSKAFAADPKALSSLEGRAKAQAALGQTDAALADFSEVLRQLPQPEYFLQYGELLESLGRHDDAARQYRQFEVRQRDFVRNGGAPADIDATLYEADHGDPKRALRLGERAVKARSFLETQDAYAWALHVNGKDGEALEYSDKAVELGMRNATLYYHRGMIEKALGLNEAAQADLARALAINPVFHPLSAPIARATLEELMPS